MVKMNCMLKSAAQKPTKDKIMLPLSFRNNQLQIFVPFCKYNPIFICDSREQVDFKKIVCAI
jgi:hypothetical protein